MTPLKEIADQMKNLLPQNRVDAAELYLEERHNIEIQAKKSEIDLLQKSSEVGVAVRLERKGRMGFAYTNDLSRQALERVVTESYNSLQSVEPKHRQFLPKFKVDFETRLIDQFDDSLLERSVSEKIDQAFLLEQAALGYDQRISQVRSATYHDEERQVLLWNSRSGARSYHRTLCSAHLMVLASEGEEQESSWNIGFSPFFHKLDCEAVATEAAEEAVRRLGATKIRTGMYPAILDRSVVAAFMGILAPSFLGESVQKNKSQLKGKLGQKIYADPVTIIDDGLLADGMVSAPCDGEGALSQETIVVSEGVLKDYLYDTVTAHIDGRKSTGNSVRSGFKEAPRPGTRNLYLKSRSVAPDDLYDGIDLGVAIHDVIGMHTANPITGDFSVGASGFVIQNGKKASPIRGFAISGNLHHIFSQVEGIGSDLKFYGPIGAPSVRITEIAVSGT